ncbi:hypothetical protein GCM10025859_53290 [Alicyclobacillus fastidiosus]|nr:hypothetical protein GCM10025859_53290 [Alicyclobacillus fastidiosus]
MSRTLGMALGVTLGGVLYQLFVQIEGVYGEIHATNREIILSFRNCYIIIAGIAFSIAVLSGVYSRNLKRKLKDTTDDRTLYGPA